MLRVSYQDLFDALLKVLLKLGFEAERARRCAQLFADTTCDGVYTHGLNRFPRFLAMIQSGLIDIHASPALVSSSGSMERWNGNIGPGNLNAYHSMERAIALSREHGLGCVALANTNHWMRGGSYGWQAANAGVIGICWTNTLPNLPPWGASDPRLGNNPLVIAVPRPQGHIVLDMAMSQFSYGALASYRMRGEMLPVEGGFDSAGRLTRDPGAIEESNRALPIGFWKGSGLALMLDLLAAILSDGRATYQIPPIPERESMVSQVFLAIDFSALDPSQGALKASQIADQIIEHFQLPPHSQGERVRYPGYRVLKTRRENLANGVPVEPAVWQQLQKL
ncbi:MAG: 3-dehydro-L-gulonate 2-dehydrogenase [Candidatus Angelobacter sp.]